MVAALVGVKGEWVSEQPKGFTARFLLDGLDHTYTYGIEVEKVVAHDESLVDTIDIRWNESCIRHVATSAERIWSATAGVGFLGETALSVPKESGLLSIDPPDGVLDVPQRVWLISFSRARVELAPAFRESDGVASRSRYAMLLQEEPCLGVHEATLETASRGSYKPF